MPKIIIFTIIFIAILDTCYSQNVITFSENKTKGIDLSQKFKNYKIVQLNDKINNLSTEQELLIKTDKNYSFILKENKLTNNNHIVSVKNNIEITNYTLKQLNFDGKYFINKNINKNKQLIMSVFENKYTIFIKTKNAEFYIEPLQNYKKNSDSKLYVIYNTSDVIIPTNGLCYTKPNISPQNINNKINNNNDLCKIVEVVFSMDYSFYNVYNSINSSMNRTLELLNLSEANFSINNGLSKDVHFQVNQHYIVTCDTCNYWPTTLEIYDNYYSFDSHDVSIFTEHYDLKIHFQNQGGSGSVIGLGNFNMCYSATGNGNGICVVKNYASNTNYTRCILSHEIGHNFGCEHNSEIMNASISGSNNWTNESITTINNTLNSSPCLNDCEDFECDNKIVSNVNINHNETDQTINVIWDSEVDMQYDVRLYNESIQEWSPYTTINYPDNQITYNYNQIHCNDKYKFEILPKCINSDTTGSSQLISFMISSTVEAPDIEFAYYSDLPICEGSNAYFSVNIIDGGDNPTYQWKINGVNVGDNSPNFSTTSLQNNDLLTCELTSNATCVTNQNALVELLIQTQTPTELSVTISSSETTICSGDAIVLTANGFNISSPYPYYQWYYNGQPIQAGNQSGSTITVYPENTGDTYQCFLNDGEGCHTSYDSAQSNEIIITVEDCNLSINDNKLLSINYYPNPVKRFLNIESKKTITEIEVFNILGKKLISLDNINSNNKVDLINLNSGTYFLKVKIENTCKFISIIKE
jgi:hypothetical protein